MTGLVIVAVVVVWLLAGQAAVAADRTHAISEYALLFSYRENKRQWGDLRTNDQVKAVVDAHRKREVAWERQTRMWGIIAWIVSMKYDRQRPLSLTIPPYEDW